jgi:protease I
LIVSPNPERVQGWNHFEKGEHFVVDMPLASADASKFDALVLPGGVLSPDQLRANTVAVEFVRQFFKQHKPVAAICHGPWTLIDAGVVRGRQMTSYPFGEDGSGERGCEVVG